MHSEPLSPTIRRRNRILGWTFALLVLAGLLWSPWAVKHGWIYPEDATYAWPHWSK